jgi:protocatechuate 3,4-dioxygenase beta subunit
MKLFSAIVLSVLTLQSATAQVRTGSIQGVVLNAGSAEPLPETPVELSPAAGSPTRYTATTDSAGQFTFSNIPPGDYRLAAARIGYLRSEYGQRGPSGRGLVVTLAAGQQMRNARVELTETGAIAGRIMDRNGQPFPNVQVQALKYGYQDGRRVLTTIRAMVTDDLGQYRIFWLPPGDYVLMAKPLRGGLSSTLIEMRPGGGFASRPLQEATGEVILSPDDEPSIPLYFPGTTTPQAATAIELRPGSNVRGIDFAFTSLPSYRVRGVVSGLPPAAPAGSFPSIILAAIEPTGEAALDNQSMPRRMTNINRSTGAFEFNGMFPGSYIVSASASVQNGNTSTTIRARVPLDVFSSDIDNLPLQLVPSWEMSGRLSIEDAPAGTEAPPVNRLYLRLRPEIAGATPQPNGNFILRGLRAGDYQLWVDQLPAGGYLKSIRLGDTDILNGGLRLEKAPETPVEVVVSLKAATIAGSAVNAGGTPATNVVIALVPDAPRRGRLDLYKNAFTDAAGRFRFTNVAPGSYKVFAWTEAEEGAWQNPQFIERYEETGKALRVEEGANATLEVTLP